MWLALLCFALLCFACLLRMCSLVLLLLSVPAREKSQSALPLLSMPLILATGYMVSVCQGTIGFMDVGLAAHFDEVDIRPTTAL